MLIRYTGNKPKKTVEFNDGVYVFALECEVTNSAHIRFLLQSDHKGLFEEVKTATEAPMLNEQEKADEVPGKSEKAQPGKNSQSKQATKKGYRGKK